MGNDRRRSAVFILTHGRPENVVTWQTLRGSGYTGPIYLIVDNEDTTVDRYRERYGSDRVIVFDKAAAGETFDIADTQTDRRATVFARNASYGIARDLGLEHFVQLDDDYTSFCYRYVEGPTVKSVPVRSMDAVIDAMFDLLDTSGASSVAWSQGGDYIGGVTGGWINSGLVRKAMNSWFCRTDRPITFLGRMNDDVNTYIVNGARGGLFLTVMAVQLVQVPTQAISGGMTELYRASGTYVKSFYTVMMAPSCTRVRSMGPTNPRMHHAITWDRAVPKILSPRHKKPHESAIPAGTP